MKRARMLIAVAIIASMCPGGTLVAQSNIFPGSGNVGIGMGHEQSPESRLHVIGPGGGAVVMIVEQPNGVNFLDLRSHSGGQNYGSSIRFLDTGILNAEIKSTADSQLRFATAGADYVTIDRNGNVGIGTTTPAAKLDVTQTLRAGVLEITGGGDLAEPFNVSGANTVRPGAVLAIDPNSPGQLRIAATAYDRTVAGIVSGANGLATGVTMNQQGSEVGGSVPVALTGRVYCLADASNGSIVPGDLLTTSEVPGHAMKVTDYQRAQGAVIGKAMSSLKDGRGLVLVLISLQ